MHPLRSLILAAAGNDAIRRLVATAPVSRDLAAACRPATPPAEGLAGSRVRSAKGTYTKPLTVAYDRHVDPSYVRCANTLLSGNGYPMFATHDPRLVRIVGDRARWYYRKPGTHEYQMLFGVRPDEQRQLAQEGETVRVYVPFGSQWYGYLMRRLAERFANKTFFTRALVSHS
ncbi:L-proline dehydrogenase [Actinocrispum wychmicini]|uniref:L-proline dehydrogenase n=1 Tax=Actinocrispum wychmicini TaxID=1213861 RepID=A0A4R2K0Q4_9PSEU|nr:L-proline dehydrogenase [Actinocrispum wychmicini]